MKRLVFISDTHNKHNKVVVPECDILIHTGDCSFQGLESETKNFAKWLDKQPAKHIVLTPGNHCKVFEKELPESRSWVTDYCPRANLLIHEAAEVEGIKFFGSPWTPFFFNWAFNAGRDPVEASHTFKPFIGDLWKDIPLDTQILVTHGPGLGTLDEVLDRRTGRIQNVGCAELTKKIAELKDLKIHAAGHTHLMGGKYLDIGNIKYINAAICDDNYNPTREPVVIDYEDK